MDWVAMYNGGGRWVQTRCNVSIYWSGYIYVGGGWLSSFGWPPNKARFLVLISSHDNISNHEAVFRGFVGRRRHPPMFDSQCLCLSIQYWYTVSVHPSDDQRPERTPVRGAEQRQDQIEFPTLYCLYLCKWVGACPVHKTQDTSNLTAIHS